MVVVVIVVAAAAEVVVVVVVVVVVAAATKVIVMVQWNLSWETTAIRDHLSWRTTSFAQKVLHFQHKWTCHQRPPVLRHHIFMANGVVFQDRFYCSSCSARSCSKTRNSSSHCNSSITNTSPTSHSSSNSSSSCSSSNDSMRVVLVVVGLTFQYNWSCHQRPPVLRLYIFFIQLGWSSKAGSLCYILLQHSISRRNHIYHTSLTQPLILPTMMRPCAFREVCRPRSVTRFSGYCRCSRLRSMAGSTRTVHVSSW